MKQPNKILVPSDLSDRSEVGIAYAAMLAEHLGSELVIMVNVNLPERAVLEEFAGAEHLSLEEAGEAAWRGVASRRGSHRRWRHRSPSASGTSRLKESSMSRPARTST
jgi:hypothetical protein